MTAPTRQTTSCRATARMSTVMSLRKQDVTAFDAGVPATPEYEMIEQIGDGGMGLIFEVRQTSLNRRIALKMIRPEIRDDEARRDEFLTEAAMLGVLEHPNIVPIHDVAVSGDSQLFYTMKRIQGRVWNEAIDRKSLSDNLDILLRVSDAVSFAHSKRIVHRDLKPENVMLGNYGEVMVMDWGIAISMDREGKPELVSGESLCGTPAYMAPEMARADLSSIGYHSDIYLLGAMLYEILTHEPPHVEMDAKKCVKDAANNIIGPTAVKGELMDIALKAMAFRPEERYASVKEFQREIREYRSHVESVTLVSMADEELNRARETGAYEGYAEALAAYKQALKLWPENRNAQKGLARSIVKYAECALSHNDLDLAESLLDPLNIRHVELLDKVRKVRRKRLYRARHTLYLKSALVMALVLLVGFVGYFIRDYNSRFGEWELLYSEDFTRAEADLNPLVFCWKNLEESIEPSLRSEQGLRMLPDRMFWLKDLKVRNSVRVDLKVRWPSKVDGLEIFVNSRRMQPDIFGHVPPGYSCQFGGWYGTCNYISRNETARQPNLTDVSPALFETSKVYRLSFLREDEMLTLLVDGEQVHEKMELLPLGGENHDWIGVRTWSEVDIMSMQVSRMSLPRRSSPLVAGDALYIEGFPQHAIRQYQQIANDFAGSSIEERALTKAFFVACRYPLGNEEVKHALRRRMLREFPNSPYRIRMMEADCITSWKNGQFEQTLRQLDDVLALKPNSKVALELVELSETQAPSHMGQQLLERIAGSGDIRRLDLKGLGFNDLAPLAGMELMWLDCSGNNLASLAFVKDMPLIALNCGNNKLCDLKSVQGLATLKRLRCEHNFIESLEPLRGLKLEILDCVGNRISTLAPLEGMPLVDLRCADNRLHTLASLRGMPLERLQCDANELEDLSPLHGMRLQQLSLGDNLVDNLEPLRGMPLRFLGLSGNKVKNLSPIAGAPLDMLYFNNNQVENLAPLQGMSLAILYFAGNRVTDLTPLTGMNTLLHLTCARNPIASLEPLSGLPLRNFDCDGCNVTSLVPLRNAPILRLRCLGNPLESLIPFETVPAPQECLVEPTAVDEATLDRVLFSWEEYGAMPRVLRDVRIMALLRNGDMRALREMARTFRGHAYLAVPEQVPWDVARDKAQAMGGHLLTLDSREEHDFALSLLPDFVRGCWLGLMLGSDNKDRWTTGEPPVYRSYAGPNDADSPRPRIMFHAIKRGDWISVHRRSHAAYIVEWDR